MTEEAPTATATAPDPTTNELLQQLMESQAAQRQEISALREELAKSKVAPPPPRSQVMSQEDLLAERMAQVEQHDYYCPGCGRLYDYRRECQGTGSAPHKPIEVVSTDELKSGDPKQHTPAPGTV